MPDDRDQLPELFEKALARHLRAAAPADSSASAPDDCPDAEILAAYHERLLSLDELNHWKGHLVGCERCRQILAQVELSDEPPVAVIDQPVAGVDLSAAAASSSSAKLASPTALRARRSTYWRWIAPAGAVAAGLLVWISWRENRPMPIATPPASTIRQPATLSAPKAAAAAEETRNGSSTQRSKIENDLAAKSASPALELLDKKKLPEAADAFQQAESDSSSYLELQTSPAAKDSARARATGPSNRAFKPQNALRANSGANLKQEPLRGNPEAAAQPLLKTAPPAPPQPSPSPATPSAVPKAAAESVEVTGRAEEEKTPLARRPAPSPDMNIVSTGAISVLGPRIIPTPGRHIIWRIQEDGRVQRSADDGESWQSQEVGVTATLLAGSAPSDKVCWLAGAFGTIVLTTDAGAHWTKVRAPIDAPIGSVVARDALHATVTLESSTVRFETADGGQTWTLVKP